MSTPVVVPAESVTTTTTTSTSTPIIVIADKQQYETLSGDGIWTRKGYVGLFITLIVIIIIALIIGVIMYFVTSGSTSPFYLYGGLATLLFLIVMMLAVYPLSKIMTTIFAVLAIIWVIVAVVATIISLVRNKGNGGIVTPLVAVS